MELVDTTEGIRVGEAKYGKGVYATRSFAAEQVVGQVQGHVMDDPDHYSEYCIDLYEHYSLEPAAPFRYVNHSCLPNCQFVQYDVEDDGKVVGAEIWLETLRPIAENEQLTIDYAWPASGAILCGCGSDNCRGWIVNEEELDQLPIVVDDESEILEQAAVNAV